MAQKIIKPQHRPPLHQAPLRSLRELEFLLGVGRETLHRLSNWKGQYTPFDLTTKLKPHTKQPQPSKSRKIDNPSIELKRVQRRILTKLLLPVGSAEFLFGGVPRKCVRKHALAHLSATTLVKMDIKSYYPSVTSRHVYDVWAKSLGCSPAVARLLTKLTTCGFHLPQGAPTSPAIANLFLSSICSDVLQACKEKKVVITVWVDDITFSGAAAREVIEIARDALAKEGLKDSRRKLRILGPRSSKTITGVRLGDKRLRACKVKVRDVRAGIHNYSVGKITHQGRTKDLQNLKAQISYIRSICPADAVRLQRDLTTVLSRQKGAS